MKASKVKLCECGCDKPVTLASNRFVMGHQPKYTGPRSKEWCDRISKSLTGKSTWIKDKRLVAGVWVDKDKVKLPLCLCGCGNKIKKLGRKYLHGHNSKGKHYNVGNAAWNKGLTKETDERVAKYAEGLRVIKHSKECECGCGKMTTPGRNFISGHNFKGVKQAPESIAKRVAKNKGQKRPIGNWNPWSEGLTKETDERVKKASSKISRTMSANFKDPKFCKQWAKSHSMSPNKLELRVGDLLNELFPNEYKFVGNFDTFIGGRCPDFMNVNGQKKLIEVYGDYWHDGDDSQDRVDHFAKYGFETLILWEGAINEGAVNGKLISFHDRK